MGKKETKKETKKKATKTKEAKDKTADEKRKAEAVAAPGMSEENTKTEETSGEGEERNLVRNEDEEILSDYLLTSSHYNRGNKEKPFFIIHETELHETDLHYDILQRGKENANYAILLSYSSEYEEDGSKDLILFHDVFTAKKSKKSRGLYAFADPTGYNLTSLFKINETAVTVPMGKLKSAFNQVDHDEDCEYRIPNCGDLREAKDFITFKENEAFDATGVSWVAPSAQPVPGEGLIMDRLLYGYLWQKNIISIDHDNTGAYLLSSKAILEVIQQDLKAERTGSMLATKLDRLVYFLWAVNEDYLRTTAVTENLNELT